jgi:hypothetical protein
MEQLHTSQDGGQFTLFTRFVTHSITLRGLSCAGHDTLKLKALLCSYGEDTILRVTLKVSGPVERSGEGDHMRQIKRKGHNRKRRR